jgi:dipeptidase E
MKWIMLSGLKKILPIFLESKVWVGDSAGSTVTGKELSVKIAQELYGESFDKDKNMNALELVDFIFLPHLNSKYFTNVRKEHIEKAIEGMTEKVYAMDDSGALKVIDGVVEVVTEGDYLEYN